MIEKKNRSTTSSSIMKIARGVLCLSLLAAGACSDSDSNDGFRQFDRVGFPAVNSALIPGEDKDTYNSGDPVRDVAEWRETIIATMNGLRAAVGAVPGFPPEDSPGLTPEAVAAVVNPDVLVIDFSQPTVFPNGRLLQDDVIDPILGVTLNRGMALSGGPGVGDGVGDDNVVRAQFPYVGPPNM